MTAVQIVVVIDRHVGRKFVEIGLRNGSRNAQEFLPHRARFLTTRNLYPPAGTFPVLGLRW